jgi:RNA polymerase sigma-70 factor (ECF subfamily)
MTWLERFHSGERAVIEEVYRGHVETVDRGVAGVLHGADRETVVHEVFYRLMSNAELRKGFHGGDLGAWLVVVARHHAIDYARRRSREAPVGLDLDRDSSPPEGVLDQTVARQLLERFVGELLPAKWRPVFEARFVRSLSQSEAAAELRTSRTTLIYQEVRIRHLLHKFLLEDTP